VKFSGLLSRTLRRTCSRFGGGLGEALVMTQQLTRVQPVIKLTAFLASARLPEHVSLMLNLTFGRFG
jgi:hypothetical protein